MRSIVQITPRSSKITCDLMTKSNHLPFLTWSLLVGVLLMAFSPLLKAGFINLDDAEHYYANDLVASRSPDAVAKIFLTPDNTCRTYAPVSILSFHIESLVFDYDPRVAHAINILLHILVAWLVMLFGLRLGLSQTVSFWGAVVFAFHPMHVQSFAWITERKSLLYSAFYLCSLIFYCKYADKKGGRYYALALLCAALSIMSKAMALSLPLAMVLVDWFRKRRFSWPAVFDKVPFVLVVVPVALITYFMNARLSGLSDSTSPLIWLWCATFYIKKFFLPWSISSFYAIPLPIKWYTIPYLSAIIIGLGGVVSFGFFRRTRLFVFSVLLYILSTFFLWRMDVWDFSAVSDRFMYLPSIGFCFWIAFGAEWLVRRKRYLTTVLLVILMAVVIVYDHRLASTWSNCLRYWDAAIKHNPRVSILYRSRAECLVRDEALDSCQGRQRSCLIGYFKGMKLSERGIEQIKKHERVLRIVLALSDLRRSLRVDPQDEKALSLVGEIMLEIGNKPKAFFFIDRVTRVSPLNPMAWYNRGMYFAQTGEWQKAIQDLDRAISLDPMFYEAHQKRDRLKERLSGRAAKQTPF
jgi:protein O-mannosyl-transferase